MMIAGRNYGTRMMRAKSPAELRREELLRKLFPKVVRTDAKIVSVNQTKPTLRLK